MDHPEQKRKHLQGAQDKELDKAVMTRAQLFKASLA